MIDHVSDKGGGFKKKKRKKKNVRDDETEDIVNAAAMHASLSGRSNE